MGKGYGGWNFEYTSATAEITETLLRPLEAESASILRRTSTISLTDLVNGIEDRTADYGAHSRLRGKKDG